MSCTWSIIASLPEIGHEAYTRSYDLLTTATTAVAAGVIGGAAIVGQWAGAVLAELPVESAQP